MHKTQHKHPTRRNLNKNTYLGIIPGKFNPHTHTHTHNNPQTASNSNNFDPNSVQNHTRELRNTLILKNQQTIFIPQECKRKQN